MIAGSSARRRALFALAAAAGCLSASCSDASTPAKDAAAPPDGGRSPDHISGVQGEDGAEPSGRGGGPAPASPPPLPPLSFVFDESAGKLRVRVKSDTPRDATVYVRVGRAASGPSREVDCAVVERTGSEVALTDAKASPDVDLVEAIGPSVNRDLLASAYGDDASRSVLSRSVIQGCLVDAKGGLLAKVSVSLMTAWDLAAPLTVMDAKTRLHGVQAYARACEAELGDLSIFQNGKLDCVAGPGVEIVPITISDPASPDTVLTSLDATTRSFPLRGAQLAAATRCDRPAWLGYAGTQSSQCSPFSRIGAAVNAQGTRMVVACRRYALRAKDDATFDDINLIAHNPTTGKTCFFNSRLETTHDASQVPSPTAPDADTFWMDVRDVATVKCTNCHDADPWVHSPWVDQVRAGGRALVPRIGEDSAYSLATKYAIFARESFSEPSRGGAVTWQPPTHLADAGKCGTCHRIGSKASIGEWVARSVGDASSGAWFDRWVSDAYRTRAKLRWMPPTPGPDAAADAAVRAILACGGRGGACATQLVPQ